MPRLSAGWACMEDASMQSAQYTDSCGAERSIRYREARHKHHQLAVAASTTCNRSSICVHMLHSQCLPATQVPIAAAPADSGYGNTQLQPPTRMQPGGVPPTREPIATATAAVPTTPAATASIRGAPEASECGDTKDVDTLKRATVSIRMHCMCMSPRGPSSSFVTLHGAPHLPVWSDVHQLRSDRLRRPPLRDICTCGSSRRSVRMLSPCARMAPRTSPRMRGTIRASSPPWRRPCATMYTPSRMTMS